MNKVKLKMKENLQIYTSEFIKNTVLFSPSKTNSKFESHDYFISRDLKKEFEGGSLIGCYFDIRLNLHLKQFKIEII